VPEIPAERPDFDKEKRGLDHSSIDLCNKNNLSSDYADTRRQSFGAQDEVFRTSLPNISSLFDKKPILNSRSPQKKKAKFDCKISQHQKVRLEFP